MVDQNVNICRVCGDDSLQHYLSIFEKDYGTTYANMIAFCCQLMITIDDGLPGVICYTCCTQLKEAYTFCVKCRNTEANFRLSNELSQEQCNAEELPAKIVDALIELPATKPKNPNEILVDLMEQSEDELFDEIIEEAHFTDADECLNGNGEEFVSLQTSLITLRHIEELHGICANKNVKVDGLLQESTFVSDKEDIDSDELTNDDSKLITSTLAIDDTIEPMVEENAPGSTLKHPTKTILASNRMRSLQALPPEEMIVEREDHGEYQVIFYSGTACCGCRQYFSSTEALEDHCKQEHQFDDPPGPHYCPLCYKQFSGLRYQMRHCEQRTIPKLYFCKLCEYICRERTTIDRHMKSSVIHNKPMMDFDKVKESFEEVQVVGPMCCDCYKMFSNKGQLANHYGDAHHPGRPRSNDEALANGAVGWCEKCHRVFKNKHKYEAHLRYASLDIIYRCKHQFCNYRTASIVPARLHLRSKDHNKLANEERSDEAEKNTTQESGERRCCFRMCQEVFKSQQALLEHVDKVHQAKQLENELRRKKSSNVCLICNCNFGSRRALQLHRQSKLKEYVCEKCGLAVGSLFQLRHHTKQVHNKIRPQRDFKCEECPRAFASAVNLRRHKQQGHEDFVCTICEKHFKTTEGLWRHWRMHNSVEKYECESCKKAGKRYTFRDVHSLNRHYKISEMHTGLRKYKCSFEGCTRTYAHNPDLKRHELAAHRRILPFACQFCQKGFIRSRELRLHERTHTGAKLYSCENCGAGFNVYQEFKRHCSEKHGVSTLIPQGSKN
ncbi:zinc finger protein 595-like [Toxorhynchites rutilus septentrionalis]|uniref:zinc finger protein 595-like n=1 Tax=Toxorhynchites rutilus septentrionalis TaxID=329112 RepID=UPI00247850E8|nr:zinc finger protein 595-like [Toxorhynchites rutilus septentrionalis]